MNKKIQKRKSLRGSVALQDLLYLILLFISVVVGLKFGIRIGAKYGIFFAVIGAFAGFIAGVGFTIGTIFFAALVSWPFEAFSKWWRPDSPPCENKSCSHAGYSIELIPEDFINKNPGFSPIGDRCKKCGNLYGYLHFGRIVHILPDGGLKPYLRHKPFGRWQPDHDTDFTPAIPVSDEEFFTIAGAGALLVGILSLFLMRYLKYDWVNTLSIIGTVSGAVLLLLVAISRISGMKIDTDKTDRKKKLSSGKGNIPSWILPWISALMVGGVATLTLLFLTGFKDSISRWMAAGCTALGFVSGMIAWGVLNFKEKKIGGIGPVSFHLIGDIIKFFVVKLIALIPGAVSLGVWIVPLAHQSIVERICVSLITGGLFMLGFFIDGLSFSQYRKDSFTGINLRFHKLAPVGLILTFIGFTVGIISI